MDKIGIHGLHGRMGQVIAKVVAQEEGAQLAAACVRNGHAWVGQPVSELLHVDLGTVKAGVDLENACRLVDVMIDFTRPDACLKLLPICRRLGTPLMIGTTGFSDDARDWIADAAQDIPIVLASNTSLGVNLLFALVRQAAQTLPYQDWDVEIVEAHHRYKVDAPSGTALSLAEAVASAQNSDVSERLVVNRAQEGARQKGEIGIASLRGGDVAGDHSVIFAADGEELILRHHVGHREIFGRGAIKAARWLIGKPAGMYSMADVLGLKG